MASFPATQIIGPLELMLGRTLTSTERLTCEEMVYAVHWKPITKFIATHQAKHQAYPSKLTFMHVVAPIMRGIIKGAIRNTAHTGFRFDGPSSVNTYWKIENLVGDEFPQHELDTIVDICRNARFDEVVQAVRIASERGIRSASYVRGVIRNQRRIRKMQKSYMDSYKKIDDVPPEIHTSSADPDANWKAKLKEAQNDAKTKSIDAEARRKAGLQ